MTLLRKVYESAGIGLHNLVNFWVKKAQGFPNVLEVNLNGPVEENYLYGLWQKLLPGAGLNMHSLLFGISLAADDPSLRALVIRAGRHDLGWGRTEELREAILRFRAAGKSVVCYLEEPENIDTFLAAACDKVVTPPGMPVYLTGLLSEVMYFKDLLDKLDVRPELLQAGKYKSAVEPYTRSGMSDENREAIEAMLDSIYGHWVKAVAVGRGMTENAVRDLIDEGPWMAEDCVGQGLIDDVRYEDELDDYIEKWLGIVPRRIGLDKYLKVFSPSSSMSEPFRKVKGIALIVAGGAIHGGESRYLGPGESEIGSDTMRDALAMAREEDAVGAVVLRIDSPGGSASHSDLIWREVERLAAVKPLVVSMADVAASGGYYIAMPADHIVAAPTTLTGSIGVIGGKLNLKGLYGKVGINKEQVGRGKHADLGTDYGPYSPEVKVKLRREMDAVYKVFVDKAAKGRKRKYDEIHEVAQGRVWTGEQAKQNGLVDELGGLLTAIDRAKERAGIPLSKRVPLFTLPRLRKISFPLLPFALPLPAGLQAIGSRLSAYERLASHPVLAMMPYSIKIK